VFATSVDREQRPASARELATLVERFLDGDRDLELRKRLAREHLDAATQAFAATDTTNSHRNAMRLAGRALALDPTLVGAAELVTRLMLEPPRDIPDEVQRAVEKDRVADRRRAARVATFACIGYVAVFVMISVLGFSRPIYPILFSAMIVSNVAVLAWAQRSSAPGNIVPMLVASGAMVMLLARMFSPFLIGPGLAAVTSIAFVLGLIPLTRGATLAVIAVHITAVLLPWLAEELGWLSRSFELTPEAVYFFAPGLKVDHDMHVEAHTYVLAGYTIVLVVAAVYMTNTVRRAQVAARRALHLQAWQLRQLVPVKMSVG